MSGELGTKLDIPYNQHADTRAAAAAYLTRTGNADLIEVLGLDGAQPPGPGICRTCQRAAPMTGRCRRTRQCRAEADRARRGGR